MAVSWLTCSRQRGSGRDRPADGGWMNLWIRAPRKHALARGYSLIELVVLCSLVGMVSAFAIPRYTRVGNEARATQVMALSGVLRGVAKSAHAQYVASGSTLTAASLDGKVVALQNGYPGAGANGIRAMVMGWDGFVAQASPDSVIFMKKGAAVAEQCAVTYTVPGPQAFAESTTEFATGGC